MNQSRFWSRVNKNGQIPAHRPDLGPCWLWTGSVSEKGYGVLNHEGKHTRAHRLAHQIETGRILPPSVLVCHHCDNPPCVRDSHLFESDNAGNSRDAVSKGRMASGERSPSAKLTWERVRQAVIRVSQGESRTDVARSLEVSYAALADILHGNTWRGIIGELGYQHNSHRLTDEQAIEIRNLSRLGESQRQIARAFGVTQRAIWQIIHRQFHRGA